MVILQASQLPTIHSSVQQAVTLIPDYGLLMAGLLVLLVLGLAFWLLPQLRVKNAGGRRTGVWDALGIVRRTHRPGRVLRAAYDRRYGGGRLTTRWRPRAARFASELMMTEISGTDGREGLHSRRRIVSEPARIVAQFRQHAA